MAKHNKPAGEADESQNELDFEQSGHGDGTIEAPSEAAASSQADWPRLEKRSGVNDRNRPEKTIPYVALPSLELNSSWKTAGEMPSEATASMRSFRIKRVAALAATVALSAALGALAGSMITNSLATSMAASRSNGETSTQLVLTRMEQEMTALRSAVDTAARDAKSKTARIAERLDRNERTQTEPLAKLTKIGEAVERLERRSTQATAAAATQVSASDVTGAIGAPRVAAPRIAAPDSKPANIISGWTLHEVNDGVALIKGRAGLIEVWPGDTLPQVGRIEAIRKQDGRWVVVTSRGLIVDR